MGQRKSMPIRVKVIPKGDSKDKSPLEGQMTIVQAIKISRLIYACVTLDISVKIIRYSLGGNILTHNLRSTYFLIMQNKILNLGNSIYCPMEC